MTSPAASTRLNDPTGPGVDAIDASFRFPVLFFAVKSLVWLLAGSLLLLVASVKLHGPAMMAGKAWLTYGRLAPAGWDVLLFGFAGQAGMAACLWVLAHAARQTLQAPILAVAGGVIWNLGVLAGLVGILAGHSTGREWLEMPAGAMSALVVGAALVGVSGWMTFVARTESQVYPSAWFVLLALLSFVWFGTVALCMLGGEGSRGVVQVLVQRWFAGGVLRLWLGGMVAAVVFHALPALVGRPLASRQLSLIAFWSLVFFAPWAVAAHGDPFPRWIVSAGLAGQFFATMGLLALAVNWWKTVEGSVGRLVSSTSGLLIAAAAVAHLGAGAAGFAGSFLGVSSVVRFTWAQQGLDWLGLGAVVLAVFGVLPELIARSGGHRLSPRLLSLHAGLTVAGVLVTAVSLILAGVVQGMKLSGNTAAYIDTLRASMHLVRFSTLGIMIFLAGQVVWAVALAGWIRELAAGCLASAAAWAGPAPMPGGKQAGVRS